MRDGSVYTRLPIESDDPEGGRQRGMVRFSPAGENTPPIAVGSEEADWYRKYIFAQARDLDASWSWSGPDIPSTKPYFNSFFVDENDRTWVRRPGDGIHTQDCDEDPEPGNPGSIRRCWQDSEIVDVFSADGRYLGEAEMPEEASLRVGRAFVRGDMIVVPVEDEAGTIMVKRYRLVLPESPGSR